MSNCTKCHKQLGVFFLRLEYKCHQCGRVFCSDCVESLTRDKDLINLLVDTGKFNCPENTWTKGYVLCKECATRFNEEKRRMCKAISSVNNGDDPERVSINYQGKKNYTGIPIPISTRWYNNRNTAIWDLKVLCRYYDCDMILDFEILRDTEDEETDGGGTYTFSIYKCRGRAVRKSDRKNKPSYNRRDSL